MTDKEIMDMGRKHGLDMLRDLQAADATAGEYIGMASFAFQGIIMAAKLRSGLDIKTLRESFNQCLDIWMDDNVKHDIYGN